MTDKIKPVKVPVIMQMEELECGAACLSMILAYFGKWLPLEQVRKDCNVSRDGSNAHDILQAARNYGMEGGVYKAEPSKLRAANVFPCVIHWNFNHFVVLTGFRKDKAIINDPARGLVEVTMEEFDVSFTGMLLGFEPTDTFEKGGKPRSVVDYARSRLQGSTAAFAFVFIIALISTAINIFNPIFSRIFLDRILSLKNPEWLIPLLVVMLVFALLQLAAAYIDTVYTMKIEGKMAMTANATFIWHVLHLPVEFFSQRQVGDISGRQSANEGITSSIINTFAPLVLQVTSFVLYLVIMIRYNLTLTLIGIFSLLVKAYIARLISRSRIQIGRVQNRDMGKLSATTVSGIEMIETIKSSGAEAGFFEKWAGYQASVNTQRNKNVKLNQYMGSLPMFVTSLVDAAILIIGVYMVIQGSFTIGMLLAFQGFLSSLVAPSDKVIRAVQSLSEMRTTMERIEDIMNYEADAVDDLHQQLDDGEQYRKLSGLVELKGVTFGYARLSEPLIKDFSLVIPPQSSVAIVGASGCGKSTISKLISGLYQPWSGEILFDQKAMNEFPRAVLTGSIAVVDQEIIIFQDSISNNIKMWDTTIEDFEMILAAKDAQLHEDIMQREGGYSYEVMEGGRDFSGGQRQRLEIARVLAMDPTIIILDEATSALDAKTEHNTVKSITDRGITCIIIAHRLSTIRDCDHIIVMDKGTIVEAGTHDELYASGGFYTKLVSSE